MVATRLWTAQDTIKAAIAGAAADDQSALYRCAVDLGWPQGGLTTDHVIIGGDTDDWTQRYAVSGLAAKDESLTVKVGVYASRRVGTFVEVRDVVKPRVDAIIELVAADPFLGGAVMLAQVERGDLEEAIAGERREAMATLWIRCDAIVG